MFNNLTLKQYNRAKLITKAYMIAAETTYCVQTPQYCHF